MHTLRLTAALCALASTACSDSTPKAGPASDTGAPRATTSTPKLGAGEAMLAVPGGHIWYKVSGSGTATPVILLHGGPGFNSYYLKPLEELGSDRKVVRYDQLGAGKSDKVSDTAMFTIPHFVAELDSLRSALGMDRVHLVGHSWGTILATEYYRAHPAHVASLTLASAALDIPAWERHAKALVKTLSDSSQRAITTREAEKKYDAPDYQKALEEFYGKYVWLRPPAADLDSTMKQANEGIYNYMQGASEFTITGTLKHYDARPFLRTVKVPVLYTVGSVDEADTTEIRHFTSITPGARMVVIPDAAHITTWDNPAAMVKAVREFLAGVDARK